MNKKFALLSLTALTALAVTGGTALAATNFRANQSADQAKIGKMNRQRPAELTEAQRAEIVAKQNEMKAKFAPIEAAITAGDYNAWVTAQKALDENCPLLAKITKDNFNRYVESFKLRQQAEVIDKELGLEHGFGGRHGGVGLGFGQGRGRLVNNNSTVQ